MRRVTGKCSSPGPGGRPILYFQATQLPFSGEDIRCPSASERGSSLRISQSIAASIRLRAKVGAKNVALIGLRDVDQRERQVVCESGVTAFTMRDIDERGLRNMMQEAIGLANEGTAGFHLSLEWMLSIPTKRRGGEENEISEGSTASWWQ